MTAPCIPRDPVAAADEHLAAARHRANVYGGALSDVERLLRVIAMATSDEPPAAIPADDAAALRLVVDLALDEIRSAWREAEPC